MAEPRIQYAKTSDGVSIAYWTLGEGEPLVHMPVLFASIEAEWQFSDIRRWYEQLAASRKLIRYDRRGMGLSERDVTDFSLDSQLLDLQAVTDQLGLKRFALFAGFLSGPVAITYATRHAERLNRLALWGSFTLGSDYLESPQVRAWSAMIDKDWEFFSEAMAQFLGGWSTNEEARRYATYIREGITPEALQASLAAIAQFDVTALLREVSSPTLILHRRHVPYPRLEVARALASQIPDARLALLEGESLDWSRGDTDAVLEAIDDFLSEGEEKAEPAVKLPQGTAVILFTDIADSTALTTKLGDAAYRERERELDAALRSAITEAGGTPVEGKVLGDGVMAVFSSASQAIGCAIRCRTLGEDAGLPLHLGIHAGDVVREGNNVHGGAVQLAARVASASAPSEILVSDTVKGLARTSAGVAFEDRGEHELKGIGEPQRLFAVTGEDNG